VKAREAFEKLNEATKDGNRFTNAYAKSTQQGSGKVDEFGIAINNLNLSIREEEAATKKASEAVKVYTDRYNRIFGTGAVTTGIDEYKKGLIDIEDQLNDTKFDEKFKEFQEQSVKDTLKTVKKNAAVLKKFRDDQTKAHTESSRFEVLLNKDVEAEDKKTDDEF